MSHIKRFIKIEHTVGSSILLFLYCGLIFFFSSLPLIILPSNIIGLDKLLHIIAYAGLGFLSYQVLVNYRNGERTFLLIIITFIFSLCYGISDEFHQSFVPGREPDVYDVIADGIGSSIGIFVYHRFFV